jgi:hypothetical protein
MIRVYSIDFMAVPFARGTVQYDAKLAVHAVRAQGYLLYHSCHQTSGTCVSWQTINLNLGQSMSSWLRIKSDSERDAILSKIC